jgi:hypothetical protein
MRAGGRRSPLHHAYNRKACRGPDKAKTAARTRAMALCVVVSIKERSSA